MMRKWGCLITIMALMFGCRDKKEPTPAEQIKSADPTIKGTLKAPMAPPPPPLK